MPEISISICRVMTLKLFTLTLFFFLLLLFTLCPYREDIYYVCFPYSISCSLCNHSNIMLGTFSLVGPFWWRGQSRLEKGYKSCSQIHPRNGGLKKLPIMCCYLESRFCPAFSASNYPCELHKLLHEFFFCLFSFSFPCLQSKIPNRYTMDSSRGADCIPWAQSSLIVPGNKHWDKYILLWKWK